MSSPVSRTNNERRMRLEYERWHQLAMNGSIHDPEFGFAFMITYLPHYMHVGEGNLIAPAEWHIDFMHEVFSTIGSNYSGVYLAPRGFAKSTIVSLALPLVVLARQLKQYIWLIQDTGSQAKQALQAVVGELDSNARIRHDFPLLRPALDHRKRPVADRDDDVVFESGARIQALGSNQKLRGRRQRQNRPDLVLIDDLENDETVATRYQRDKLDLWLSSAVMGALGPDGDVYYVGTLLHHDAILARLQKREGWTPKRYEAVTNQSDFSTTTWPQFWPKERLETQKLKMGPRAFAREVLHIALNEEEQLFKPANYQWRESRLDPSNTVVRIAVDPATGLKDSSDFSSIVVVARQEDNLTYDVLSVWRGRVRGSELQDRMAIAYENYQEYKPLILVEATQAQVWAAQAMMERGYAVRAIKPQRDKVLRAEPISVMYENKQVYHHPDMKDSEFELELEQFPMGEHDDMVDALVYALGDMQTSRILRLRAVG